MSKRIIARKRRINKTMERIRMHELSKMICMKHFKRVDDFDPHDVPKMCKFVTDLIKYGLGSSQNSSMHSGRL